MDFDFVGREKLPVDLSQIIAQHTHGAQLVEGAEHEVGGGVAGGEPVKGPAESSEKLIHLVDVIAGDLRSELGGVPAVVPAQRIADVVCFPREVPEGAGNGAEVSADGQALPAVRYRAGRRNVRSQIRPLEIRTLHYV